MLDPIDRKLLSLLQVDATLTVADLGESVGLSMTACWKRLKRLEQGEYITARVALLDRARVGLPVTVFVTVRTNEHNEEWLADFARPTADFPEIVALSRLNGDAHYLMKVGVANHRGSDHLHKALDGAL